MSKYNAFDSHSSQLTNVEFHKLHLEIDSAGIIAANTLHFSNIQKYYNSANILYIRVKPLLNDNSINMCENIRFRYNQLIEIAERNRRCQGKKLLRDMLNCCNGFFEQIVAGLQNYQYYIRVGIQERKGLKSIFGEKFSFEDSGSEENEDDEEDYGDEEDGNETEDN